MIKKLVLVLKKLMLAVLFIYAFNKMAVSLNLFIPINIFTILLVTFCGVPAIIMLVIYLVTLM